MSKNLPATQPDNTIDGVRTILFDTLRGLSDKKNPMAIDRAKAISDVAQTITNTVRAEIDFARATKQQPTSGFIPSALLPAPITPAIAPPQNLREKILARLADSSSKNPVDWTALSKLHASPTELSTMLNALVGERTIARCSGMRDGKSFTTYWIAGVHASALPAA